MAYGGESTSQQTIKWKLYNRSLFERKRTILVGNKKLALWNPLKQFRGRKRFIKKPLNITIARQLAWHKTKANRYFLLQFAGLLICFRAMFEKLMWRRQRQKSNNQSILPLWDFRRREEDGCWQLQVSYVLSTNHM